MLSSCQVQFQSTSCGQAWVRRAIYDAEAFTQNKLDAQNWNAAGFDRLHEVLDQVQDDYRGIVVRQG